jgi:ribosomal protein S15P/S13E
MANENGTRPILTYAWLCADQRCDNIDCYKSTRDSQTVCKLWTVTGLSDFHDADLAEATDKINAILNRLEQGNKDKERKLSFIKHQNRRLLVWAGYGRVGPDDDFKVIKKALKLRT